MAVSWPLSNLVLECLFLGSLTSPKRPGPAVFRCCPGACTTSLTPWEIFDMNASKRALAAAVSTAALLVGLVACGGSDSSDSASSSNSAAADRAGGDTQAAEGGAQAEDGGGDAVETPLTGEAKQKAEAAALAEFPGTVIKSEEDAENPGTYAVEIKKADGSEVEVYLDPKTYKVVKTKDEAGDDD
ncbi:PepSY domain-containing protein [Streptomyces sp. K1PN6]|uniref:PepSY domain-containing protein n=2 Tax=Streptomyces acidicola TaxID=2596892 RepID=A0A5N8WZ54_9ACTN|nr:PepSY domain-containing protein [Streptomyces acidicola]